MIAAGIGAMTELLNQEVTKSLSDRFIFIPVCNPLEKSFVTGLRVTNCV